MGRTFLIAGEAGQPDGRYQVVGVVPNTKYYELREDFLPIAFLSPWRRTEDPGPEATFVLRTSAPPGPMFRSIKTAAAEVSPAVGHSVHGYDHSVAESLRATG